MVDDGNYRFYTCAKHYYRIDNYAFEGEALLIAGNGAYLGYIHHYVGRFNAYQRTYVLQDFEIDVPFLKAFLDCKLPPRIQMEKKDGNTPYIVLAAIADMPLLVPPSAAEQKRVAACLSSLDEMLAAQLRKVEGLTAHKKALLQQLFPSIGDESR
jgi:type I restriction enzyme S subunit